MKKEYKHVILISFIVIILVNLPLIFFFVFPKDGLTFLGRRVINSQDMYTYLSYIEQSREGKWLLENLYTTESQKATLIRPSYVIIGKFAALTHTSSLFGYHAGRIGFSIIFCIVLYAFIRKLFEKESHRLVAFILVLSSSGLGFLLGNIFPQSSDLWIPESNTFLTLSESPHFILSQILMLLGFMMYVSFLEKKRLRFAALSCLCFVPLAFEHPFDLIIAIPVIFLFALWERKVSITKTVFICLICLMGLMYPLLELKLNPLYALEQIQGASISPAPINYLLGFGFLIPLALVGAEKYFKSKKNIVKLLFVWIAIGYILLYAPVSFQRRMSEGLHIPIAIFASVGLVHLSERINKRLRQLTIPVLAFCVVLLSCGSFYSLWNDYSTIAKNTSTNYYYFISRKDKEAIDWLGNNSERGDIILSNWFYGNLIPMIGRKVYVGHTAQTIHFDDKIARVNAFLIDQDIFSSITFLHQNNIKYIYLGKNDAMKQYGFKPDEKEFLNKVYDNEEASIYKVTY